MKKFIVFIGFIILFASCSTTKYIINEVGDIALLNTDGQTVKVWRDAVLESETVVYNNNTVNRNMSATKGNEISHKNKQTLIQNKGAYYFWDKSGNTNFVDTNSGVVIISNIHTEVYNITEMEKEEYIDSYKTINNKLRTLRKFKFSNSDVKIEMRFLESEKDKLRDILWRNYNIDARMYDY